MNPLYEKDIEELLSHRFDQGSDDWMGEHHNLLKGAPFSTLDCIGYLVELGMNATDSLCEELAKRLLEVQKPDGRFKIYPSGGIYPCHTALAFQALCAMGYAKDPRLAITIQHFLSTQQEDGGWKCHKYSFGKGPETEYSTPLTTLNVVDAFRYVNCETYEPAMNRAVEFLLQHWDIKQPISPCHYGIGTLFHKVEYPFRGYNLFYYVYVLSFYAYARRDRRFLEAYQILSDKLVDGQVIVERVVPKLAKLSFCEKGKPSALATLRYQEIQENLAK